MSLAKLLDEDRGSPLPLEPQHRRLVGIVSGEHLVRVVAVRPEHPERQMSLATIRPAKMRDLVPDLDVERLSDELSTHTRFPAPRMQACGGGAGCDSASGKSSRTQHRLNRIGLTFVATAQRIGIAA